MNNIVKTTALLALATSLSACMGIDGDTKNTDKSLDRGWIDSDPLTEMVPGIWVDPNGCDHWIIDDGVEGYLSARLDPNGKPVCSGHGMEGVAYGPFKSGSSFNTITE